MIKAKQNGVAEPWDGGRTLHTDPGTRLSRRRRSSDWLSSNWAMAFRKLPLVHLSSPAWPDTRACLTDDPNENRANTSFSQRQALIVAQWQQGPLASCAGFDPVQPLTMRYPAMGHSVRHGSSRGD